LREQVQQGQPVPKAIQEPKDRREIPDLAPVAPRVSKAITPFQVADMSISIKTLKGFTLYALQGLL
jgi:hypothetical protein